MNVSSHITAGEDCMCYDLLQCLADDCKQQTGNHFGISTKVALFLASDGMLWNRLKLQRPAHSIRVRCTLGVLSSIHISRLLIR